jgi:N4-gp56 family major capsid protein
MATTEYPVGHPLAVKLWSRKLLREALKQTWLYKFMGEGTDNIIQIKTETSKSAGDRITVGLRMLLTGAGVSGDGTLEGNEEALTTYSDNIFIDQLRHAVRSAGKMTEQRVPFSVREEARAGLQDWWSDRLDTWGFNQLCGYTVQTDTRYTGLQATIAPSSGRILVPDAANTSHTNEVSLSTTQTFQLSYIDRAVTIAKTASPLIRPIKYKGGEYFVMFLHPNQTYQLRTDATSGRITWYDAQKARVQGGEMDDNGIFNGALGMYNGVVLHESTRITNGVNSSSALTNVRRAVLCGAQAGMFAFGRNQTDGEKPNWYEELFDYGNQLGVAGGMIAGCKKSVFNSTDFGTIVVSTYSPAVT